MLKCRSHPVWYQELQEANSSQSLSILLKMALNHLTRTSFLQLILARRQPIDTVDSGIWDLQVLQVADSNLATSNSAPLLQLSLPWLFPQAYVEVSTCSRFCLWMQVTWWSHRWHLGNLSQWEVYPCDSFCERNGPAWYVWMSLEWMVTFASDE